MYTDTYIIEISFLHYAYHYRRDVVLSGTLQDGIRYRPVVQIYCKQGI